MECVKATGGAQVAALLLFSLIGCGTDKAPEAKATSPPAGPPRAATTRPVAPAEPPPISFNASGSLPAAIRGYRLGMTLPEARAADATLKPFQTSGEDSWETTTDDRGFSVNLIFGKRRLSKITYSMGSISPSDALLFDKQVFSQLGAPTAQVWQPRGDLRWVWIDGDIRIGYTDHELMTGREVLLEFAVYPALIDPSSYSGKELLLGWVRRNWGEPSPESMRPRQLPRAWAGLQLGISPAAAREALPALTLQWLANGATGKADLSNGNHWTLSFWRGGLISFCEENHVVKASDLGVLREHYLSEYGDPLEPVEGPDVEWLVWNDGQVRVDFQAHKTSLEPDAQTNDYKSVDKPWTLTCVGDEQLRHSKAIEEAGHNPPKYKPVEHGTSFF
jgi:hypothetical protein